jgi:hypothetical protein
VDNWGAETRSRAPHGVASGDGHGDSTFYSTQTTTQDPEHLIVVQNVVIPAGTVIDCSAWGKVQGNLWLTNFSFKINGQRCASMTIDKDADWTYFGGQMTVTEDSTEIRVYAEYKEMTGSLVTFGLDDIAIFVVSGPGFAPCGDVKASVSTPTLPANASPTD